MGVMHPHGDPKLPLTESPWEGGGASNLTEGQSSKIMVLDHWLGNAVPQIQSDRSGIVFPGEPQRPGDL